MDIVVGFLIAVMILLLVQPVQAASRMLEQNVVPVMMQNSFKLPALSDALAQGQIDIEAVDGSDISGKAVLTEVPENMDTDVKIKFENLVPDEQYVAIYHRNEECQDEEGSVDKVIKGAFFADQNGKSEFEDKVKDSVNRIGSISLREADNFEMVACGKV